MVFKKTAASERQELSLMLIYKPKNSVSQNCKTLPTDEI
jgi:hypothetical protein